MFKKIPARFSKIAKISKSAQSESDKSDTIKRGETVGFTNYKKEILEALGVNLWDLNKAPVFSRGRLVVEFRDGHVARFKVSS